METLRCDDLQNGYCIWQDPSMFCFGVDAVLLAHYPRIKEGDCICDLGTGFAPIPLIMAAEARDRELSVQLTGLEIQERAAEIAGRSVEENGLAGKVRIVQGDIREAGALLGAGKYTLVTSNPPYMSAAGGLIGKDRAKAIARTELLCTLEDVVSQASLLLAPGGRFAMIHRPFRLVDIFEKMRKYRIEPKRLRMVHPFSDAEPTMVLVEGTKGGKAQLTVEPPLVLYHHDHTYTEEVLQIYGRDTVSGRDTDR